MSDDVKFLDLFNPKKPRSEKSLVDQRMEICMTCPFYNGVRCTKCGCFMALKTTLLEAHCPVDKW